MVSCALLDLYTYAQGFAVVRLKTGWSHCQYQVLGTTSTYAVFVDDIATAYCSCPAFAYSVLLSDGQFMVGAMRS